MKLFKRERINRDKFVNALKKDIHSTWHEVEKNPKKKYVPFDLSDPDVRKSLRGRWITDGDREESQITGFLLDSNGEWNATTCDRGLIDAINLQAFWKFDDGTPCGQLMEG